MTDYDQINKELFLKAIEAADPKLLIPKYIPKKPKGKLVVIGCGKASAAMAKSFEENYDGDYSGIVVTNYGNNIQTNKIEILEASHPVPDINSYNAAKKILNITKNLCADDQVLFLLSGGGSALLCYPEDGIDLQDKIYINEKLLQCGAKISEMNVIRKLISGIKGGRLAENIYPAKVVTLAISDIPNDDPLYIASSPTVIDANLSKDVAFEILKKYKIELSEKINQVINGYTPPKFFTNNNEFHIIATPKISLDAASNFAKSLNFKTHILSDSIEGESKDVGMVHSNIINYINNFNMPFKKPCILLSGGETTVSIKSKGKGGRNSEFLLSALCALTNNNNIYGLAADTDGKDGSENNAGVFFNPNTIENAKVKGLIPEKFLNNNDSYSFFSELNQLIITGHTNTNVNDFRSFIIT
ncbi:MAG: glycerate kinase [Hydrogenophilales bacterium]